MRIRYMNNTYGATNSSVRILQKWCDVLQALGRVSELTYLDLSRNQLEACLEIQPPLMSLRYADLSQNSICQIAGGNLADFQRLSTLLLDKNGLEGGLDNLADLPSLTSLSLKDNKLISCEGLELLKSTPFPLFHLSI